MHITVDRVELAPDATIGSLSVDGEWLCWTCEDAVREAPGRPVAEWKAAGQTAIPAGTYRLVVNQSPRFRRSLPLLLDVPGFVGIRIHPGNSAGDTEGCILPGLVRAGMTVSQSRKAFDLLFGKINDAIALGGQVTIELRNP